MITKILITLVVMVGVAIFFRTNTRTGQTKSQESKNQGRLETSSSGIKSTPKPASLWVYGLASALIAAGVIVFYLRWLADHKVVEIRVIDGEHQVVYEAYQKDIKGKTFTAIDGRQVTIGENQRIETLTR